MSRTKVECQECFDEEGSYNCIRPSHPAYKRGKVNKLKQLVAETVEPIVESSDDTFITAEFAKEANLSRSAAQERLTKLQETGRIERVRLVGTRNGVPYRGVQGWRFLDPVREQSVKKNGIGSGGSGQTRPEAVVKCVKKGRGRR